MAGSSDDGRRRHRGCPADLRDAEPPEEGELVPGCDDSDMDTDDYYNNHNYYSSSDTDETTSDCTYARSVVPASYGGGAGPSSAAAAVAANNNNGNAVSSSSPVAAPAPAAVLACPICGKEFRSRKAVCGHMKVHQQGTAGRRHEQQQGIGKTKGIKRNAAVAGRWGSTGKRGWSGCWSNPAPASPNAIARSQSDQSMAVVVANPNTVLRPMPLAFAAPNPSPVHMESATPPNQSSSVPMASATPNPSSVPIASTTTNVSDESSSAKPTRSDAMDTVVAGAANPPTEAVVHLPDSARAPPPSPPPAEVRATSVHQQPIELLPPPPDAEEERVQVPPVHYPHPIAPPLPLAVAGRQNPNGYTCSQCGAWFPTHQGLGGHMAGHKTRELAAVPRHRDDDKPEKVHECRICDAVFSAGVQLGGHMRKHYTGAPIVPKKKPRLAIQPLPPPAAEQGALEPAPRPAAVAGILRLFGVNIVEAGAQTPGAQEEGSSATQASTGGELQ